jgi:hypothetical protein
VAIPALLATHENRGGEEQHHALPLAILSGSIGLGTELPAGPKNVKEKSNKQLDWRNLDV